MEGKKKGEAWMDEGIERWKNGRMKGWKNRRVKGTMQLNTDKLTKVSLTLSPD